jgi:O-antigen ligase
MEGGAAPFFKNDPKAHSFPAVAGIALLGTLCGLVVAFTGLDALYLCGSLIGCAVILYDFRIGVVLLILLAPISGSQVFPHAMLGITGLNPLNLLLAGTFASYLLHGLFDGSIRRFLPGPLLWLYCVPILIAGALGSRHVGDIVPGFFTDKVLDFNDAIGYIRDLVVKPLLTVVFALLVGAAVAKSEKPEKFLIPTVISIWVMGAMVIVFVYSWGIGLGELASSTEREFLTPLGIHANELGRLYAVAYALLLFTWAESEQLWLKAVLLASMVLVVVALALTFSRSAFFDLVLINLLFVLWRRNVRALVFLAVLAVIALFALPDAIYQRSTAGFGQGLDAISAGRIQGLWLPLLPEVARSPIYGSGLGSILWSEAMHKWGGVTMLATTHPHNAYLQALLDMGIVGLVLLCAYFVHVWRGFRALSVSPDLTPTLRGFYLGAAAGLVGFLIAAVADGSLAPRPEQAFLWLAIGMMYGQRSKTGDAAVAERRR